MLDGCQNNQSFKKGYSIIKTIGQGSYGTVYQVVHLQTNKYYALKKIHINPFKISQVLQQLQIMDQFKHNNILHAHQSFYDEENNIMEIVMEYCQDGDLLHYFKKKNKILTQDEILSISAQIVKALMHMNIHGIFHRDLKPQNIMLNANIVKIGDFGCAKKLVDQPISEIDNYSLDKGTPIYSSPQHLLNQPYSAKCDVWSFGMIIYYLYFRYHPIMDSSIENMIKKMQKLTKNIPHLNIANPYLNKTIFRILNLTLQYEQKDRASFRQLSLARLFKPKILKVQIFLLYLRNISIISNWLAKNFWQSRKQFTISLYRSEQFVYYLIKYQYTVMQMAKQLLYKQNNTHSYLLDEQSYNQFEPSQDLIKQIEKSYVDNRNYYYSIKNGFEKTKPQVIKIIDQKHSSRLDCFYDLDNSIRYCYKIMLEIIKPLFQKIYQNNQICRLWIVMSRWINFQAHYNYQLQPRIQKILTDDVDNMYNIIKTELSRYKSGFYQ